MSILLSMADQMSLQVDLMHFVVKDVLLELFEVIAKVSVLFIQVLLYTVLTLFDVLEFPSDVLTQRHLVLQPRSRHKFTSAKCT
jgi:hypothetical protein